MRRLTFNCAARLSARLVAAALIALPAVLQSPSPPPAAACERLCEREAKHPIHVTLTTIDFNPKTRSLEISCKIFADDLETIVNRLNNATLRLGASNESKDANALLFAYLKRHLNLEINGKAAAAMTFVGKEFEGEAAWLYLEIPNVGAVKRLSLTNSLLLDLYEDQSNVVNVAVSGARKSALCRKGKEAATLEFE